MAGSFFRPINQEAVSCLAEWAQDDKEALDVFKALGRRVLDLRAIYEIDVPCSRTSAMRGPSTSAVQRPALGRFGFGLVAFAEGGLLIGVVEIELRVISL